MDKITLRGVPQAFQARKPFDCNGTLTARYLSNTPMDYGQLPTEHAMDLRALLITAGKPVYVVYSYATPVAWVDPETNEVTIPDVKYSATTSKHVSRLR